MKLIDLPLLSMFGSTLASAQAEKNSRRPASAS